MAAAELEPAPTPLGLFELLTPELFSLILAPLDASDRACLFACSRPLREHSLAPSAAQWGELQLALTRPAHTLPLAAWLHRRAGLVADLSISLCFRHWTFTDLGASEARSARVLGSALRGGTQLTQLSLGVEAGEPQLRLGGWLAGLPSLRALEACGPSILIEDSFSRLTALQTARIEFYSRYAAVDVAWEPGSASDAHSDYSESDSSGGGGGGLVWDTDCVERPGRLPASLEALCLSLEDDGSDALPSCLETAVGLQRLDFDGSWVEDWALLGALTALTALVSKEPSECLPPQLMRLPQLRELAFTVECLDQGELQLVLPALTGVTSLALVESDGGGEPIILESTVFAMPALQALTLELLTLPLPLGFSSNEAPPAAASTLRTLCIASAVTAAVPDTIAALTHLDCLELADSSDLSPPPSAAFAALLDALAELPELSILVVDREGLQLCPSAQAQLDSLLAVCERRQLLLEAKQ